jgi:hypothetical protein
MKQWTLITKNIRRIAIVPGILATMVLVASIAGAGAPQKVDKAVPKQQRAVALGEDEVKQLLLLMDADKSGKVSKKEFMDFMAAEFDRLDKDKSGELDVKELSQSQIRSSRPASVGK